MSLVQDCLSDGSTTDALEPDRSEALEALVPKPTAGSP